MSNNHVSHSLNSSQGVIQGIFLGSIVGVLKGYDNISCESIECHAFVIADRTCGLGFINVRASNLLQSQNDLPDFFWSGGIFCHTLC